MTDRAVTVLLEERALESACEEQALELGSNTYPHMSLAIPGVHGHPPAGLTLLQMAAGMSRLRMEVGMSELRTAAGLCWPRTVASWRTANGLEGRLVLDRGWTLSRHWMIPSLQLSPVVSGRYTGR